MSNDNLILLFREVIGKVGRKNSQIQFIFAGRVENKQKNGATEFDTNIWLGFSEVFLNSYGKIGATVGNSIKQFS